MQDAQDIYRDDTVRPSACVLSASQHRYRLLPRGITGYTILPLKVCLSFKGNVAMSTRDTKIFFSESRHTIISGRAVDLSWPKSDAIEKNTSTRNVIRHAFNRGDPIYLILVEGETRPLR